MIEFLSMFYSNNKIDVKLKQFIINGFTLKKLVNISQLLKFKNPPLYDWKISHTCCLYINNDHFRFDTFDLKVLRTITKFVEVIY